MSLTKYDIKTTTYRYNDDFLIDIVQAGDYLEAWIYRRDYGVKDLMFGTEDIKYDEFLDTVAFNAASYTITYDKFHKEGE